MRDLFLFNTLSGKKERFRPLHKGYVGMYVCGITPYDVTHLGHAFTYTIFDVLLRYLRFLRYRVTYVENITDIDDDIIRKAREVGENWRILGERYVARFLQDMHFLNNVLPNVYPRATDHVDDMITIIDALLRDGYAYERGGNVYFWVESDKEYGKLSKLSREEMLPIANERGNNPNDDLKRHPLDFVLWQARKPGEPFWQSPWGKGRPGWHIECSAMSAKYLGQSFDIHGGGKDLVFPHHESSIAQSEGASKKPFVRYWMHTEMVRYQGEKMSKSLGNLILISDLAKRYTTNAVRLYLLSHHYREVFDFVEKDLLSARAGARIFARVWRVQSRQGELMNVTPFREKFYRALSDDLDTPAAIAVLQDFANHIISFSKNGNVADAKAFLQEAFSILGLHVEYT